MTGPSRVVIRDMEPTDSALSVASLIYDTEEDLFRFLFGPRTKALKRLSRLILMRNHAFSYERIKVLEKGDDVVGILIESNPRKQTDDNEAFMKGFGVLGLIGLLFKMMLLFPLLNESGIKGRYIQNVSVLKAYRGMGLGSMLLDDAIRRAKEDRVQTLTLDVNIKNERARALYERKGFVIRKTRRIWGIFKVTYRMDLDPYEHPGMSQDT